MSRPRTFPICVCRYDANTKGCGHQHTYIENALNCAENILKRNRKLDRVTIHVVTKKVDKVHDTVTRKDLEKEKETT